MVFWMVEFHRDNGPGRPMGNVVNTPFGTQRKSFLRTFFRIRIDYSHIRSSGRIERISTNERWVVELTLAMAQLPRNLEVASGADQIESALIIGRCSS